ncbi:DUF1048 domain-containing protein [Clostridium swellfunianum]|uniref:DUF1048 domain-containing protein n=1 Tax=Clostridium swellfunianum TaxID=1367462 RepID=UPI00202EC09A|nr:DUF1048 domain-containing protein [Clostridium swellfunianum]MCM0648909.1 DUF1048 domain-containing protein [Clostridium swellfunianum]
MLLELRLLRIRIRQQTKLNEANREAYDAIKDYLSNSSLVFFEREEVLQQVLDMMLQAQIEDKDINLFLGNDHKNFCDSIISEYSTTKSFMLRIISFIEVLIFYMLLGIVLDMIFLNAPSFTISTIIYFGFFFFIFNPIFRKSKKEIVYPRNNKMLSPGAVSMFLFVLYIVASRILYNIGKKHGLDLLHAQINIYALRYLLIFSILFVLTSETYKLICNKQRVF